MVVYAITHLFFCADIGLVRPNESSRYSHFSLMEEHVGVEVDVALHGVERNLTKLKIDVPMTDVEDLPMHM